MAVPSVACGWLAGVLESEIGVRSPFCLFETARLALTSSAVCDTPRKKKKKKKSASTGYYTKIS